MITEHKIFLNFSPYNEKFLKVLTGSASVQYPKYSKSQSSSITAFLNNPGSASILKIWKMCSAILNSFFLHINISFRIVWIYLLFIKMLVILRRIIPFVVNIWRKKPNWIYARFFKNQFYGPPVLIIIHRPRKFVISLPWHCFTSCLPLFPGIQTSDSKVELADGRTERQPRTTV